MEPIKCPKCNCTNLIEITDGLWQKVYYEYDTTTKRYKEIDTKYDGCGDHYFECWDCGAEIEMTENQARDFIKTVLSK